MKLPRPSRTMIVAAAVVVVIMGPVLGLTVTFAYAGDVPRGTRVLGVDIGAMSRAEAEAALSAGLAARSEELAAPVQVQVGDVTTEVVPEEVGLAVDVPATVAQAAGDGTDPIAAMFGSPRDVAPVVEVDAERLDEVLQEAAGDAGEVMTMPEITFEGTEPVPVYPEPGLGLDPQRSAEALAAGWPSRAGSPGEPAASGGTGGSDESDQSDPSDSPDQSDQSDQSGDSGQWVRPEVVTIPLVEVNPVTTAEDVDRLVEELAEPAVAAPVTVRTSEGENFEVPPAAIAKSLRLTADRSGEIVPEVKPKPLRKVLADQLAEVETEPVDAKVVLEGGGPAIVDSVDGARLDTKALAKDLLGVLPEPAPREVEGSVETVEAELGRKEVEKLGIEEQVSTFTSYFDGGLSLPRSQNIVRVAEIVDGAMVMPGETFSLNGYTGERGYDQGFVDAPVILGGKLVPAVGGGISQFTTTLFNASYYAGLEDVEHHPHSYYYSRYPAVIESTIFYPSLDMQFRNNTDYGVLIDTSYTSGSVTVTMWSTKVWDKVETEYGPRRDVTKPKKQYLKPGPKCIATTGINGFTQDAWRVFYRDGQEVQREKFTWRYDAQPEFVCGEKPDRGDDD